MKRDQKNVPDEQIVASDARKKKQPMESRRVFLKEAEEY